MAQSRLPATHIDNDTLNAVAATCALASGDAPLPPLWPMVAHMAWRDRLRPEEDDDDDLEALPVAVRYLSSTCGWVRLRGAHHIRRILCRDHQRTSSFTTNQVLVAGAMRPLTAAACDSDVDPALRDAAATSILRIANAHSEEQNFSDTRTANALMSLLVAHAALRLEHVKAAILALCDAMQKSSAASSVLQCRGLSSALVRIMDDPVTCTELRKEAAWLLSYACRRTPPRRDDETVIVAWVLGTVATRNAAAIMDAMSVLSNLFEGVGPACGALLIRHPELFQCIVAAQEGDEACGDPHWSARLVVRLRCLRILSSCGDESVLRRCVCDGGLQLVASYLTAVAAAAPHHSRAVSGEAVRVLACVALNGYSRHLVDAGLIPAVVRHAGDVAAGASLSVGALTCFSAVLASALTDASIARAVFAVEGTGAVLQWALQPGSPTCVCGPILDGVEALLGAAGIEAPAYMSRVLCGLRAVVPVEQLSRGELVGRVPRLVASCTSVPAATEVQPLDG